MCILTGGCAYAPPDHSVLFTQAVIMPPERICLTPEMDPDNIYRLSADTAVSRGFHIHIADHASHTFVAERDAPVHKQRAAVTAAVGRIVAGESLPALHRVIMRFTMHVLPGHLLLLLQEDHIAKDGTTIRHHIIDDPSAYRTLCNDIIRAAMLSGELD